MKNFYFIAAGFVLFGIIFSPCWASDSGGSDESGTEILQDIHGSKSLVPLKWSAGCGIDSLYLGLHLIGHEADYLDLIRKAGIEEPKQRVDLNVLWQVAREVGAHALAIRAKDEERLLAVMKKGAPYTAILHLKEYGEAEQHLACAYLARDGSLKIAGEATYQPEIGKTWRKRWSGVALILSKKPFANIPTSQPIPKIHFDAVDYDAGHVPVGSIFNFVFDIQNKGEVPLNLEGAFSSCNCGEVTLSDSVVPVGGMTQLVGEIRIGNIPGQSGSQISVVSNDPERPRVDLMVTWEVDPPVFAFNPSQVKVAHLFQGQAGNAVIEVMQNSDQDAKINKITTSDDWIQCELSKDARMLKVNVRPEWSQGVCEGSIYIDTESPVSRINIPVEVQVRPLIIARPAQVFSAREANEKYIRKVVTLHSGKEDLKYEVLKVELQGVPGSTTVKTDATGDWQIELNMGPFTGDNVFAVGYAIIKTSHTVAKQLKIPIYIK
jgi:hypothetical protein